jgi:hypothetical protein
MKPEIEYELWKNSVISAARELYRTANQVASGGLDALAAYNDAHHKLWDVMEREPQRGRP